MKKDVLISILTMLAVTGNGVFIVWVTYNAIDEGFNAATVQYVSYIGLMALLVINIVLLLKNKKTPK
jgi:hypothetical protein